MNEISEAESNRFSFFNKIFKTLRFPYRNDSLFSVIFFGSLFVPLAMFNYLSDGSESPKLFLWLLCFGLALIYLFKKSSVQWRLPKFVTVLLVLYLVFTLFSTIFSYSPIISLVGWYGRFTSSLLFSLLWVGWIVTLTISLDREKIIFLLKTLSIVGVAVAVYGIIQQQGFGFYSGLDRTVRSLAPSFLGNPNFSSMFLAGIAPLTATCLILAKSRQVRYVYGVSLILILWALMGFSSRGAIVGLLVGLGSFGLFSLYLKNKRWLFVGLIVTLMFSAGFFYTFYLLNRPDAAKEVVSLTDQTSSFRLLAWNDALEIIANRPLVGTGPGNFLTGFRLLGDQSLALNERFDDPHNIFLHIGGSVGLPALATFIVIICFVIFFGWRALCGSRDPIVVGLISALVAALAGGSFNPVTIGVWYLMAFCLGALIVMSFQPQEKMLFKWAKFAGVVFAGGLLVYSLCFLAADAFTYQVVRSYNNKQYERTIRFAQWTRYLNPVMTVPRQYEVAARVRLDMDFEQTRELIRKTERINPMSADLQRRQTVLYFMLYDKTHDDQDKAEIINAIEQTLAMEPRHALTEGTFAYSYFRLEDYEKMLTHLRQALILNPNDFYSWILLAKYYQGENDKPKMLFALEKAYALNTDTIVFKRFLQSVKEAESVKEIYFPVVFPPIAL